MYFDTRYGECERRSRTSMYTSHARVTKTQHHYGDTYRH